MKTENPFSTHPPRLCPGMLCDSWHKTAMKVLGRKMSERSGSWMGKQTAGHCVDLISQNAATLLKVKTDPYLRPTVTELRNLTGAVQFSRETALWNFVFPLITSGLQCGDATRHYSSSAFPCCLSFLLTVSLPYWGEKGNEEIFKIT